MTELSAIEQKLDDLTAHNLRANPPQFMTSEEVATFLRVSPDRVYQWRKEGIGPKYHRPTGRLLRYHVDDVVAWMTEVA